VRRLAVLALAAFALAGCGGNGSVNASAKLRCPEKALAGWQRLADRIHAPVFCPAWIPDPLDGVIGSQWNNINAVSRDRSYLESWVWQETGMGAAGGEKHVNLRGYPGRTRIPKCVDADSKTRALIPCFADSGGKLHAGGLTATVYNVNQDADQWHILYAWRYRGGLYTVSEHVAPPFGYRKVRQNLDHMLRNMIVVQPAQQ
jgi:hypothetical protein